mmetsp:Transcript_14897/g.45528  ORF Transcript_14897/g.45528 Transcript_14897/m.45528 type:complete len:212 (-) Transcript_14897:300-935(-)
MADSTRTASRAHEGGSYSTACQPCPECEPELRPPSPRRRTLSGRGHERRTGEGGARARPCVPFGTLLLLLLGALWVPEVLCLCLSLRSWDEGHVQHAQGGQALGRARAQGAPERARDHMQLALHPLHLGPRHPGRPQRGAVRGGRAASAPARGRRLSGPSRTRADGGGGGALGEVRHQRDGPLAHAVARARCSRAEPLASTWCAPSRVAWA